MKMNLDHGVMTITAGTSLELRYSVNQMGVHDGNPLAIQKPDVYKDGVQIGRVEFNTATGEYHQYGDALGADERDLILRMICYWTLSALNESSRKLMVLNMRNVLAKIFS